MFSAASCVAHEAGLPLVFLACPTAWARVLEGQPIRGRGGARGAGLLLSETCRPFRGLVPRDPVPWRV